MEAEAEAEPAVQLLLARQVAWQGGQAVVRLLDRLSRRDSLVGALGAWACLAHDVHKRRREAFFDAMGCQLRAAKRQCLCLESLQAPLRRRLGSEVDLRCALTAWSGAARLCRARRSWVGAACRQFERRALDSASVLVLRIVAAWRGEALGALRAAEALGARRAAEAASSDLGMERQVSFQRPVPSGPRRSASLSLLEAGPTSSSGGELFEQRRSLRRVAASPGSRPPARPSEQTPPMPRPLEQAPPPPETSSLLRQKEAEVAAVRRALASAAVAATALPAPAAQASADGAATAIQAVSFESWFRPLAAGGDSGAGGGDTCQASEGACSFFSSSSCSSSSIVLPLPIATETLVQLEPELLPFEALVVQTPELELLPFEAWTCRASASPGEATPAHPREASAQQHAAEEPSRGTGLPLIAESPSGSRSTGPVASPSLTASPRSFGVNSEDEEIFLDVASLPSLPLQPPEGAAPWPSPPSPRTPVRADATGGPEVSPRPSAQAASPGGSVFDRLSNKARFTGCARYGGPSVEAPSRSKWAGNLRDQPHRASAGDLRDPSRRRGRTPATSRDRTPPGVAREGQSGSRLRGAGGAASRSSQDRGNNVSFCFRAPAGDSVASVR